MYCTGLIEKSEICQALCNYGSDRNKEAQDFFVCVVPGQLLQIKEFFIFNLLKYFLGRGKPCRMFAIYL